MTFWLFQRHGGHKSRFSPSLNGQHWRFLRSNLDYSREAFLPSGESILTQPARGPSPLLLSEKPKNFLRAPQRSRKRLTEPQSNTSKLSQKDHIAQVEYCLSQHPLALYPNFQESIPAELFKEVMSILDPEVVPTDQESDANLGGESCPPMIPSLLEGKRNRQTRAKQVSCKDPENKAPYTWFSPQKVAARKLKARLNYVPPLDKNIKRTTKELCDGFNSLGGEKYNVDEDTVLSLFDVGYETTLPMFHPLRVEELRDLPMDLKKYFGMPPSQAIRKKPDQDVKPSKDPGQSRWKKTRYGAWYLDPKMWKKQNVNEPLENPKESSLKNSRRLLSEEDAKLIQVHGTHAFQEFLVKKGYRIPEFLQQMLEEQKVIEPKVGALNNTKDEPQKCKELREDYSPVVGN
ncbi:protein FAM47E-like [Notechis scutatus]|uniref:Protein FAM47E-like n=1 Tax=Notechis scutatus TaxID=8663 RepID=A0A6J1UPF8_9SAUR|nr:protein FAM47E-like [Notechis scutatus]